MNHDRHTPAVHKLLESLPPPTQPLDLIPLSDPQCQEISKAGGKAATLARLWKDLNAFIPAGVVVPSSHTPSFIGDLAAREAVTRSLMRTIDAGGIVDPPWAVRSSAVEEDSAEHSFAGQFETVLGVASIEALPAAVARCVASLATPRAMAYRRRSEGSLSRPPAVLIQTMIPADRSGVAFGRHPVSGAEEVVINASYGLGDLVVSGQVTPDEFVLGAQEALSRFTLGRKHQMNVLVRGAPTTMAVPASMQEEPSLTAKQSEQIAELVRRSEALLGYPVDMEWVISRGRLYLVQARPITVAGPSRELHERRSNVSD